jgi:uncharacterized membrane protein (DUF106 family)
VPNYHNLDPHEELTWKHYLGGFIILAVPAFFEISIVNRLVVNFPTWIFKKYMNLLYKCLVDWTRSAELKKEARTASLALNIDIGALRDNRKIISELPAN